MKTIRPKAKYEVSFLRGSCFRSFEHIEDAESFQNARVNDGDFSAKILK